jgi:LmbE family N-acetylglucosaminyl deacetylase
VLELAGASFGTRIASILCLGAHCDDIEIGCGGTVLKLLETQPDIRVDWVVFSSDPTRADEARAGAAEFLVNAGQANVRVETFEGRFFPYVAADIKRYFDRLGAELAPDVVFTHCGDDLHQDHRLLAELAYNTFRDHLILEYEIPKYDGDLGRPNAYVYLDERQCEAKIESICRAYESQASKHWFSRETFLATLRLRGIECRSPSGFAEAFYCRKLVLA